MVVIILCKRSLISYFLVTFHVLFIYFHYSIPNSWGGKKQFIERYFSFHLSESYTRRYYITIKKLFPRRKFPIIYYTFRKFDYFFFFFHFWIIRSILLWNYESVTKVQQVYTFVCQRRAAERKQIGQTLQFCPYLAILLMRFVPCNLIKVILNLCRVSDSFMTATSIMMLFLL